MYPLFHRVIKHGYTLRNIVQLVDNKLTWIKIVIIVGAGPCACPNGLGSTQGSTPTTITLGRIIAYFKYESTKQINQYSVRAGIIPPNTIKKIFQRNYYEHIICKEFDLNKIREYIVHNPLMWDQDRNNKKNYKQKGE